jgi:crotonobetainyl-CoA:carnitine CoA-transferase CaiB-like acyl-CoA transferase
MTPSTHQLPLCGIRVVEWSDHVGAAYAGRLLATLGGEVILVEPPAGSALRHSTECLPGTSIGAGFSYLAAGKESVVCDLSTLEGRDMWASLLHGTDIFITDLPLSERAALQLDEETVVSQYPNLIYTSVLPFGAIGPKANWVAREINLIHAAGEGYLLPNGLTIERFPDRPPLKIHGHFAEMEAGVVAALGALSALWCRPTTGGQAVDISEQDATFALCAFAVQRYGDGSIEHRAARSFKYGGVLECIDGVVELLTLEERQWQGLIELMGRPDWILDPALFDPLERSRRGAKINEHIRAWGKLQYVKDIVGRAQALGVPMAKYFSPSEVLGGAHEHARGLFQTVDIPGFGACRTLVSPFHIDGKPLTLRSGPPRQGSRPGRIDQGRGTPA